MSKVKFLTFATGGFYVSCVLLDDGKGNFEFIGYEVWNNGRFLHSATSLGKAIAYLKNQLQRDIDSIEGEIKIWVDGELQAEATRVEAIAEAMKKWVDRLTHVPVATEEEKEEWTPLRLGGL